MKIFVTKSQKVDMNSEDKKNLIEKFIDKFDFSLDERNEIIKNTFKKTIQKGRNSIL